MVVERRRMINQILHDNQLLVTGGARRTVAKLETHLTWLAHVAGGAKPLYHFVSARPLLQAFTDAVRRQRALGGAVILDDVIDRHCACSQPAPLRLTRV